MREMANDFMERRLRQLKPIGATMVVRDYNVPIAISTIQFGDGRWTRVEDKTRGIVRHYQGDLQNHEASRLYRAELDDERAA